MPHLGKLLTPLLEHIASAGVAAEAITLLTAAPAADQSWLDDLPEAFEEVRVEAHDPKDRKRLAYLAMTRAGQRLYLNRSAVDADQLIALGRPDAEPLLWRGGAGMLYPALSDEATREELSAVTHTAAALRKEAAENGLAARERRFWCRWWKDRATPSAPWSPGRWTPVRKHCGCTRLAGAGELRSWRIRLWPRSAAIRGGMSSPTWLAP